MHFSYKEIEQSRRRNFKLLPSPGGNKVIFLISSGSSTLCLLIIFANPPLDFHQKQLLHAGLVPSPCHGSRISAKRPLSNSPSNLSIQFLSLSFIPFSSSNIPAAAGACVMTVSDVNSYSYASFSPSVLRGGAVFLHNSLIILRACNNTNDAML
eukprot:TRINITY_DN1416_c0_g1_i2.p1 TRINITY_DN1416_c0_g1~~TRINITY_DN1416_c0_g1_i2.p1  ORF type:complete len:154 (+),score=14.68 TRINITY_DN1416_c0_g1_i2:617-1078(+)